MHLFIAQHRSISLADFLGKIKSSSSRWVKTHPVAALDFAWQSGYGYFAVGSPQFNTVCTYIEKQKEHHAKGVSFQDEMRAAYRARSIAFDERYVWD
jgi:REP element-mobilizing transposase RayT